MSALDFLPAGMAPEDAITLLAAAGAFLTVLAVWNGLTTRTTGARRARELATRRDALRQGLVGPVRRKKQNTTATFMRQFVDRLNLQRTAKAEAMQQRLTAAGWRHPDAVVRYLFLKATLPITLGVISFLVFQVAEAYELSPQMRLAVMVGSILFGFWAPDIVIRNAISKRNEAVRKALPDALDLMVICAEAGLSLDALLKRVAGEFARSGAELAEELSLTSLELGFLPDRREALLNLSNRCNQPGVRGLVNSLIQSEKYGTPLAQSLRVLSHEYREERMLRAEEKAARLPALLTVPMILFILPPLFVVLIGPAILRVMDAFTKM